MLFRNKVHYTKTNVINDPLYKAQIILPHYGHYYYPYIVTLYRSFLFCNSMVILQRPILPSDIVIDISSTPVCTSEYSRVKSSDLQSMSSLITVFHFSRFLHHDEELFVHVICRICYPDNVGSLFPPIQTPQSCAYWFPSCPYYSTCSAAQYPKYCTS